METKKRKHHYVFQAYLKGWATNGMVWCLRGSSKPFNTSTENVLQERDFYRVKLLNADEMKFVDILTQLSHLYKQHQNPINTDKNA